jgi:hypothetical protein
MNRRKERIDRKERKMLDNMRGRREPRPEAAYHPLRTVRRKRWREVVNGTGMRPYPVNYCFVNRFGSLYKQKWQLLETT